MEQALLLSFENNCWFFGTLTHAVLSSMPAPLALTEPSCTATLKEFPDRLQVSHGPLYVCHFTQLYALGSRRYV